MLHFFRQIRRKLLSGNQFQKYLFYAIGEIVLVVIGILIALQINNWNELRQQRKNAVELYKNISAQLVQDRENIQGQILYNRRHMHSFQYAIELIGSDNMSEKDSLSGISGMLADYSDFDREGNIYTRLVNSGDKAFKKRGDQQPAQSTRGKLYLCKPYGEHPLRCHHADDTRTYPDGQYIFK